MTTVGFYAHHHGAGHLRRCRSVASEIRRRRPDWSTVIATSAPATDAITLPTDVPTDHGHRMLGNGWFHWAPDVPEVQARRVRALADWVLTSSVDFVVVDVSVEVVAALALMGVPTGVVRLHGDRTDRPHRLAFDVADLVFAPFPERLEHESTPTSVADRTRYVGLVGSGPVPAAATRPPGVGVVWGQGSAPPSTIDLEGAARSSPRRPWHYVGPSIPGPDATIVRCHGWIDDPAHFLAHHATVAVGPCGDGMVADVAASAVRFVAIPQERPFDEQRHKAQVLAREHLAVHVEGWPQAERWPGVLARAAAIARPGDELGVDGAAVMAEAVIDHLDRTRRAS